MSSEKPDQIQASVAAALSRLRGDLGPSGATAPKGDMPAQTEMKREMGRPANDVRGDPFFRSIQSPPASASSANRDPIPMTPFARMQASQEPAPSDTPSGEQPVAATEPDSSIDMPEMPERASEPDLAPVPEAASMAAAPPQPDVSAVPPQPAATAAPNNPLARIMRGTAAEAKGPAQRDLLAGLPPPPISEPLTGEPDSSAMHRRRRNRRLLAAAAVIVVLAIGAWLWSGSEQTTEVPVIAAESTPEKVKPADEGGLQVPNQNVQVLENMAGAPTQPQGETVMPEPEQPVTPPAPSSAPAPTGEQSPTVVDSAAPDSSAPATAQAPAVDAPPTPEAPLTTSPLPEQTENATAEAAATPPPPQPAPTVAAPEPAQATEAAPTSAAPASSTSEQAPAQEPAASAATEPAAAPAPAQPEPAVKPEPATTQEAAIAPAAPVGKTRIQLAAGKSEEAVKKAWAAMQKAHPDLLGALSLNVERVDKGAAGVFYRLQAGPLADKAAARKLCASLKQAHQDCIVVN